MLRMALLLALSASPALAEDFLYFRSPTGNIHCMMASGDYAGVRCDMIALTRSFPKAPADCELDWGDAFEIGPADSKGQVVCHGDTVIDPESVELGYGTSAELDGFICFSEKTGMTCENGSGHGFAISKATQRLY
jgi:hypothetical protein